MHQSHHFNYFIPIALLIFVGCTDTDAPSPATGDRSVITAVMTDPGRQSRTCVDPATYNDPENLGILWTVGDSISVYGNTTVNALFRNTRSVNSPSTTFAGTMSNGDRPLYAYYPYNPLNAGRHVTDLIGTVSYRQSFDMSTGLITDDYKTGRPLDGKTDEFTFDHLFSLLKVDIDATGTSVAGQTLEYISVSVSSPDGTERAIAGDFHFNATAGSYSNVSGGSNKILIARHSKADSTMPDLSQLSPTFTKTTSSLFQ